MYCNKCGKEIKDGYTFCSNCGNKAEDIKNKQENEQPNNKKIGKMNKKLIYAVIGTIIVIFIISGIVMWIGNNKKSNNMNSNTNINYDENSENEDKKVYITNNSNVSPTGKEFIGEFSQKLRDAFGYDKSVYFETSIEGTSIPNLKQYVCTGYSYIYNTNPAYLTESEKQQLIKEGKATRGRVIRQDIIYYNELNNKIIAIRQKTYDLENFLKSMNQTEYTTEQYFNNEFIATMNIFMNFHNDNTSNEAKKLYEDYYTCYLEKEPNVERTLQEDVNTYTYKIIGNDLLQIRLKLLAIGNQLDELYLAYDENTNAEETIKNWYGKVKDINNTENLTTNSNEDINNSNTDINIQSSDNNNDLNANNPSSSSNNNTENSNNSPIKEEVSIADLNTETLSYNEFVSKVKQRGLNIVEKQTNNEIPYYQTTKDKYYEVDTSKTYYKGDTVTIYLSKIVPVTKHFNSDFILCGYSVILSQSTFLDESKTKQGVKLYFNNKLVMSGDGEFDYKFTSEKQITIKAVAPYILIDGEWKKNYTVLETTDSVEKLMYYADSRMGIASAYRALLKV